MDIQDRHDSVSSSNQPIAIRIRNIARVSIASPLLWLSICLFFIPVLLSISAAAGWFVWKNVPSGFRVPVHLQYGSAMQAMYNLCYWSTARQWWPSTLCRHRAAIIYHGAALRYLSPPSSTSNDGQLWARELHEYFNIVFYWEWDFGVSSSPSE